MALALLVLVGLDVFREGDKAVFDVLLAFPEADNLRENVADECKPDDKRSSGNTQVPEVEAKVSDEHYNEDYRRRTFDPVLWLPGRRETEKGPTLEEHVEDRLCVVVVEDEEV